MTTLHLSAIRIAVKDPFPIGSQDGAIGEKIKCANFLPK